MTPDSISYLSVYLFNYGGRWDPCDSVVLSWLTVHRKPSFVLFNPLPKKVQQYMAILEDQVNINLDFLNRLFYVRSNASGLFEFDRGTSRPQFWASNLTISKWKQSGRTFEHVSIDRRPTAGKCDQRNNAIMDIEDEATQLSQAAAAAWLKKKKFGRSQWSLDQTYKTWKKDSSTLLELPEEQWSSG